MAYEIITDTNHPQKEIPAWTEKARYRKTFDFDFKAGDNIKVGGALNGNVKQFCEYIVPNPPAPAGKKMVLLVDVRVVEIADEPEE